MMTLRGLLIVSVLTAGLSQPQRLSAEGPVEQHPFLSNKFFVSAGIFFPDKNFKLAVNGSATAPDREIDFEDVFRIEASETTGAGELRWRFGDKWQLQGQYWTVGDGGSAVLARDVEWEDIILEEGSNVSAEVGIDVYRVFLGRRFLTRDNSEFGAGFGFHWLDLSASVAGQIFTNMGDSEPYFDRVSAAAPLPNLGAWYLYSFSPKWALTARLDWLSASIDEYSGSITNAQVGANWAVSEHLGIGATWNFFRLDVDVDKSDWNGGAEISQNGPFVSVYATW